jgi:hypothetical protein
VAFALAAKMKYSKAVVVRMKANFPRMISGCRVNAARRSLLVDFANTYTPLDARPEHRFETEALAEPLQEPGFRCRVSVFRNAIQPET